METKQKEINAMAQFGAQTSEVFMAKLLSSTDVAIAQAMRSKTLDIVECWSDRLNEAFWAIEDAHGVIETHLTLEAVNDRLAPIEAALQ